MDLVRTAPGARLAGAAKFALGKHYDPGLTEFFIQVLRDDGHGDAGVLYQAMIALDNLGRTCSPAGSPCRYGTGRAPALAADFVRRA